MSPTKVKGGNDQTTNKGPVSVMNINGSRPSPLKISKDSHWIHKPFDSGRQTQRQPLIIYTHSPKIIHTKARDFMSLVQKLTGFSPSGAPNSFQPKLQRTLDEDLFSDVKDIGVEEGSIMYDQWHDDDDNMVTLFQCLQ